MFEGDRMSVRNRAAMPYGWGGGASPYQARRPWMNLPFPMSEYHERLDRLRSRMAQDGLDCLVVLGNRADNSNIRYLTNFEDFYGGGGLVGGPRAGAPRR